MEEEEIVLACTSCVVVYWVAVLDHQGVGDPPVPAFCPYCGQKLTVTDADVLAPIERRLKLVPRDNEDHGQKKSPPDQGG